MLGWKLRLWLTMYAHKDTPRWWEQTNYWGIRNLIWGWRHGYRKFNISRQPPDPHSL